MFLQVSGYRMQDAGFKMLDAGCWKIVAWLNSRFRILYSVF